MYITKYISLVKSSNWCICILLGLRVLTYILDQEEQDYSIENVFSIHLVCFISNAVFDYTLQANFFEGVVA